MKIIKKDNSYYIVTSEKNELGPFTKEDMEKLYKECNRLCLW